jgi:hypothetical protein
MTVTAATRSRQPTTFADILDKGLVIDAFVRVSLVGIEVLTIDARVVLASVDTYLKFAEAVNRLDLYPNRQPPGVPELLKGVSHAVGHGAAKAKVKGALSGAKEKASDLKENVKEKATGLVGRVRHHGKHEHGSEDEEQEHEDGGDGHGVKGRARGALHGMKEMASDIIGTVRRRKNENEARPEEREEQDEDEREESEEEEREEEEGEQD